MYAGHSTTPVFYYLLEHITKQLYDEHYPKGDPYTHCNINLDSNYKHPYLDGAAVGSLGTIVQHTDHYLNVELHMVPIMTKTCFPGSGVLFITVMNYY